MFRKLFFGLYARLISPFIAVRPDVWVFGADYGRSYREGSKYLLQYMLQTQPQYNCCFITQNPTVLARLQQAGIPCLHNFSFQAAHFIARAGVVITTQAVDDIRLAYRRPHRRFLYLGHGQPFKVAIKSLSADYLRSALPNQQRWLKRLQDRIYLFLLQGNDIDDVEFVSVSSPFLVPYFQRDFGPKMQVRVLPMPRNEALFKAQPDDEALWPVEYLGHRIITYMPTHRKYGQGALSPLPFLENAEAQQWLRQHNYILLVKQHPNMIPQLRGLKQTDVVRDITTTTLDPQLILRHTDVLITDYSSVWIDYLLLRRPVLFYLYDDFETADAGCYYDYRSDFPGHFCEDESGLLRLIQQQEADPTQLIPSDQTVAKYHQYQDGDFCKQYFQAIIS